MSLQQAALIELINVSGDATFAGMVGAMVPCVHSAWDARERPTEVHEADEFSVTSSYLSVLFGVNRRVSCRCPTSSHCECWSFNSSRTPWRASTLALLLQLSGDVT